MLRWFRCSNSEGPNGEIEPLQSVYKVKPACAAAFTALEQRGFRNLDMIRQLERVTYVQIADLKRFDPTLMTFYNLNSQADLERAKVIYRSRF